MIQKAHCAQKLSYVPILMQNRDRLLLGTSCAGISKLPLRNSGRTLEWKPNASGATWQSREQLPCCSRCFPWLFSWQTTRSKMAGCRFRSTHGIKNRKQPSLTPLLLLDEIFGGPCITRTHVGELSRQYPALLSSIPCCKRCATHHKIGLIAANAANSHCTHHPHLPLPI